MKDTQRPPGHLNQDNLDRFRSEGELNISQRRKAWQEEHLDHETREWLARDAKYFLHQSLSTPCIDVLASCKGSFLEDLQGNRFLDFHGNNVHQVGFGHEHVIAAIREQMGTLSFCTRRYTLMTKAPLVRYGAECYAYGLLASGFIDLIVDVDLDDHDFGPLDPVVSNAGGIATDWQGNPLTMNSDGRIIVAGDARLLKDTIACLNR